MSQPGRFSKLELDEPSKVSALQKQEEDRWPDQDEHSCSRLGEEEFYQGLYEAALVSYSRVLRFNKDRSDAWVGQIRCLLRLGENPEADTWSQRALERFKDQADLLACSGLALIACGLTSEGMEYLDGAIESRNPSSWVWGARGEGLLTVRQPEANARRCFLKAIELASTPWHAELDMGFAFNRAKMYAQARPPLVSALKGAAGNPLLLFQLAVTHEGLGDRAAAAGYYERSLAIRRSQETEMALRRVRQGGLLARLRGRRP